MNSSTLLERAGVLFYLVSPNASCFPTLEEVPDYILQSNPFFVVLIFAELFLLGAKRVRMDDGVVSSSQGFSVILTKLVFLNVQLVSYTYVYNNWRLATLPWNSLWTWWICFLGVDFCYYWLHRGAHEINILWAAHQVHHSSEEYNLSTALRRSVIQDHILSVFNLPLALAIPPSVFMVHYQLTLIYQFWLHTELISSLGPLEYVLNTPSHHRVHHGRNRYCIDKNYGGTLIIWDRLFGTFQAEKDQVVYGLTHPVNSFNLFYIQFFHFIHIWKTFWKTKGLSNKLSVVFKGPGWSPGKPWRGNLEDIPDVKGSVQKFAPGMSQWCIFYALVHLVLLNALYLEFAANRHLIPTESVWSVVIYDIMCVFALGLLLENRSFGPWIELLRCSSYVLVEHYLLPYTRLYKLAPYLQGWILLGLRSIFIWSFLIWLQHSFKNCMIQFRVSILKKQR